MEDLIKALQIFANYQNSRYPTFCEHDKLTIMDIYPSEVSDKDIISLEKLGFNVDEEEEVFYSFRFGSA